MAPPWHFPIAALTQPQAEAGNVIVERHPI
jgi:hypothetical protein